MKYLATTPYEWQFNQNCFDLWGKRYYDLYKDGTYQHAWATQRPDGSYSFQEYGQNSAPMGNFKNMLEVEHYVVSRYVIKRLEKAAKTDPT